MPIAQIDVAPKEFEVLVEIFVAERGILEQFLLLNEQFVVLPLQENDFTVENLPQRIEEIEPIRGKSRMKDKKAGHIIGVFDR